MNFTITGPRPQPTMAPVAAAKPATRVLVASSTALGILATVPVPAAVPPGFAWFGRKIPSGGRLPAQITLSGCFGLRRRPAGLIPTITRAGEEAGRHGTGGMGDDMASPGAGPEQGTR